MGHNSFIKGSITHVSPGFSRVTPLETAFRLGWSRRRLHLRGHAGPPAPAAVMEASGVDSHSFLRLSSSNKSPAGLNLSPDGGFKDERKKRWRFRAIMSTCTL